MDELWSWFQPAALGDAAASASDSDIFVFLCDLSGFGRTDIELESKNLDAGELQRYRRLGREDARFRYAASHLFLRGCLSLWMAMGSLNRVAPQQWRFIADALGKPQAETPGTSSLAPLFSLSHTRDCAAVAVGMPQKLGIDIEMTDRSVKALELAERFFTQEEKRDIFSQPGPGQCLQRFIRYWTLKESYLKALGLGLTKRLFSFAFQVEDNTASLLYDHEGGAENWRFLSCRTQFSSIASVAIKTAEPLAVRWLQLLPGRGWSRIA